MTALNNTLQKIQASTLKQLIQPHGGQLVSCYLSETDRQILIERSKSIPKLVLSDRNLADLECIATGVYSPLDGFVNQQNYDAILEKMRLVNGLAWSIPVTLQIPDADADLYQLDTEISLMHPNGQQMAVMTVTSKFQPDLEREAKLVYHTNAEDHPGIRALKAGGAVYLGGPIQMVNSIPHPDFHGFRLTPIETRQQFIDRKWSTIAAFQTRNPIHRAHEYITKIALESVDGLFINPLVGTTKSDDISADVRMKCYQILLEKYYPQDRVLLGVFPSAMRYAGPREAIMHAIARQNYGCTHFIVGRDHAGVGNYYGTYDAQYIFDEFNQDELKITPFKFEHAFYCTRNQAMATAKTSPSKLEEQIHLSGTKVREMLRNGVIPPQEFTRPEVAAILIASMQSPATIA